MKFKALEHHVLLRGKIHTNLRTLCRKLSSKTILLSLQFTHKIFLCDSLIQGRLVLNFSTHADVMTRRLGLKHVTCGG